MPSNRNDPLIGFHISRDRGTVREPRGAVPIQEGKTYRATGRLKLCNVGVHASPSIEEAAHYRFLKMDRIVSLVRVWGDVRRDGDKFVGRHRKVLAAEKLRADPPLVTEKVFTGVGVEEVEVVDPKWIADLEKRLHARYRRNKRSIDRNDELVILSQ